MGLIQVSFSGRLSHCTGRAKNNIGGSNLPVIVSIKAQDKTLLNINIDTGIR